MQNKISVCVSLMQEVAKNKNAVIENEREASRNNVFFTSYTIFAEAVKSYLTVQKYFDFHASEGTDQLLRTLMSETAQIFQAQKVINPQKYRDQVQKCTDALKKEWTEISANYASQPREDLGILKMITPNKMLISQLIQKLTGCQSWPVSAESAAEYLQAQQKAAELLAEMHFDANISAFLSKVKAGNAVLADLTSEVTTWLTENGLMDKIFLRIQV